MKIDFEKQAETLVSQMTLKEKIGQMVFDSEDVEHLGIKKYNWWNEALHGVARAGKATMFPQAIGMAATFNKDLLKKIGDVISTEGRAKYSEFSKHGDYGIYKGLSFWSPNINIFRDPRWGRGHETYGEDPYLTGELAVNFIKGIQGEDENYLKASACAKHFAAHSGPEGIRHSFDALVSKKDLAETYLPAFEKCVKEAHVESVMGAYNRLNGEACNGSHWLLTDLLRDTWGFNGHVVSDCWAICDMHGGHKLTEHPQQSAALAVKSGCDLNCGSAFRYLEQAVAEELVSEDDIDKAVVRLLTAKLKLGLIGDHDKMPYKDIPYDLVACDKHQKLSLEAALESIVLLKNNGILPLKNKFKKLSVIGPNARSINVLKGNYYGDAPEYITVLDGIRKVAKDVKVDYAQGCGLIEEVSEYDFGNLMTEAVITAEKSDAVILCLGLDGLAEAEEGAATNKYIQKGDKITNSLPEMQQQLLEKMIETGKPLVVVLMSGSSLDLSLPKEKADAIIETWYPGALGGLATAQILFGLASPSGRLPVTFYKDYNELPDFTDYSMQNRTYRYFKGHVVYPFGYGLSYTDFTYTHLKLSKSEINADEPLTVSVDVTNSGTVKGKETVELYLRDDESDIIHPIWQLKGFEKIELLPGKSKTVKFTLHQDAFAIVNEQGEKVVEKGSFTVFIGSSQPDALSRELTGKTCLSERFFVRNTELLK